MTRLEPVERKYIYLYVVLNSEKAKITINLLRTARTNKRLPAYAQIFGIFYFNETPMAPPGTKIVVHEKPNQLATWSKHGVLGFYIEPALEHYGCLKLFLTEIISGRIADVAEFSPQILRMT